MAEGEVAAPDSRSHSVQSLRSAANVIEAYIVLFASHRVCTNEYADTSAAVLEICV
jgi:hypothetical protein